MLLPHIFTSEDLFFWASPWGADPYGGFGMYACGLDVGRSCVFVLHGCDLRVLRGWSRCLWCEILMSKNA